MYYTILVIRLEFREDPISPPYDFLIFSFLIKSSIRCILIAIFQKVIQLGLVIQFVHGDAHFLIERPNLTPKSTFESQISNFQLLIWIFSPKWVRGSNKWKNRRNPQS